MTSAKPKKIGVLTSGGDAPGMNAAIRAVVRSAIYYGMRVTGIRRGYNGLIHSDFMEMSNRTVSDTIHRGGTILLTARCDEMRTEEGQERAANVCRVLGLEALIVIGGDGSFIGANNLSKRGINVIGIPASIDLDMPCTDYTIGFDTAINTGMDAITKIRDTSSSHERCSIVEVMGRNAGHIALWCSLTAGAEEILIPEAPVSTEMTIAEIIENRAKGKPHNLVVVAEGIGGSVEIAKEIQKKVGVESRAMILGHLQRGGTPSALDRMHASFMGYHAVKCIVEDKTNRAVVFRKGEYQNIDLEEAIKCTSEYNSELYDVAKILSI